MSARPPRFTSRAFVRASVVVASLAASACSTEPRFEALPSDTAGQGGSDGASASTGSGGGGGGGGQAAIGCAEGASQSIYLVGWNREFYRFKPATLELTSIGVLDCVGEELVKAESMAVGRNGVAWVRFANDRIFQVSTSTGACMFPGFKAAQAGFTRFGMGFVSDAPGSDAETLYISDFEGAGLGMIDISSLTVIPVANVNLLSGAPAELTGTGDARLFGYFQTNPITLAEIDKETAEIVSKTTLDSVPIETSFAFAFWGGDFWMFSGPSIRRYQPSSGLLTLVSPNVGFQIVGAGVSTCAPGFQPQ